MSLEFQIKSRDGLRLHACRREPTGEPTAVVCMVHGLGEHCGRYGFMADAFNRAGFAWFAMDLRGHGKSEGMRGHAPGYDGLMSDIARLLEAARRCHPNSPLFLYGHSLGGNLAIQHALRERPALAGVVASAPLLRLAFDPPRRQVAVLRILNALRIRVSLPSGLDVEALSRDPEVLNAYRNDPLTHGRITPALAVAMIENGRWNLEHAPQLPCPLLLLHGDADRITSSAASRDFAERAGSSCTLKIWNGLYHELHNEPERREVVDYVLEWMERILGNSGGRGL